MRIMDTNSNSTNALLLPAESTLVVELIKKLFRSRGTQSLPCFVATAIRVKLPLFILENIIGVSESALSNIKNPASLKIHAVDALKAILEADETKSDALKALYDSHPAWLEYKGQSHDLFLSNKDQADLYLIEDSSEKRFIGLLKYEPEPETTTTMTSTPSSSNDQIFQQLDRQKVTHTSTESERRISQLAFPENSTKFDDTYLPQKETPSNYHPAKSTNPFADESTEPAGNKILHQPTKLRGVSDKAEQQQKSSNLSQKMSSSNNNNNIPPDTQIAPIISQITPVVSSNNPPKTSNESSTVPTHRKSEASSHRFMTTIIRSEHGLGLDLLKTAEGNTAVKKIKDMPPGVINPATICFPPIKEGDLIIGVNGKKCQMFAEVVKEIRASGGSIELVIERLTK